MRQWLRQSPGTVTVIRWTSSGDRTAAIVGGDARRYDIASNTVTVTSRVLGLFWANITYHAEHHSYPRVPFYRLARLHALLHSRADTPYLLSPYTMYGVFKGTKIVGMLKARGRAAIALRAESKIA